MTQQTSVRCTDTPDVGGKNTFYVGSREPLEATPFRKLPIGSIKPEGWLRKQLTLEADGFSGHLEEISPFLKKEGNAWLSADAKGENGWEEVPYWLKGFGDLGYVLGDKRIIREARFWIDHVLAAQDTDGWLGPREGKTRYDGKPDMWPNMIMLNVLQSYYEYSHDSRVIQALTRYFRWQLSIPDDRFYADYWEVQRGGDNMASVYWLYNRTGEPWLLDLVEKIHRRTADWTSGIPDWHGVNFAQAFREPAEYGWLKKESKYLDATERNYTEMRRLYGEVPGGMYGADENARPGYGDPRQGTETCAMVEMMLSNEMLLAHSGDARWAERCEDVTFNSLPASMTPDLKGLHYLTSPNLVLADKGSKSPGIQNGGAMFLFNPFDYRCCQHNVAHGWPYFSENLWYGTDDNGLAAALYAPCKVTARVDSGQEFTVEESTNYPFSDRITFKFSSESPARFPVTLRLPSWCTSPSLALNGHPLEMNKGSYAIVETEWKDGDELVLHLPMHVDVVKWPGNKDAVSIQRGPLEYSLKVGEKYVRDGGTDAWPAYAVEPTTPWNYGLTLENFKVVEKPMPASGQPFDLESVPLEIKTGARRIPGWTMDKLGLVGLLQQSPARTSEPEETVTLVPMGAARLRISTFPTVSPDRGIEWTPAH